MSKRSNEKRKKSRSKINKGYTSSVSPPKMKHRGGMAKKGTCNVCGRFRKLEFDHIPPKATRKIIQSQSHYLKNKTTDMINLGKKYENTQVLGFNLYSAVMDADLRDLWYACSKQNACEAII